MQNHLLESRLDRFVELLGTYNEGRWHAHFREAQVLMRENRIEQAKQKIRGAYGGMGSISDGLYFTGAPKEIAEEGYTIRGELYTLAKPEGLLSRITKYIKNEN